LRFARVAEDSLIGGANGFRKTGVGMAAGILGGIGGQCVFGRDAAGLCRGCTAEAAQEGLGSEMAGDFPGCGPSNAVADDESPEFGQGGAGVLIDVADAAAMGKHGESTGGRRRGSNHGGGANLRLGRFQSRGTCHFGTLDRHIRRTLKQYSLRRRSPMVFHSA